MQIEIPDPLPLIEILRKAQSHEPLTNDQMATVDQWLGNLLAARSRYLKLAEFHASLQRKTEKYFPASEKRTKAPAISDAFWKA